MLSPWLSPGIGRFSKEPGSLGGKHRRPTEAEGQARSWLLGRCRSGAFQWAQQEGLWDSQPRDAEHSLQASPVGTCGSTGVPAGPGYRRRPELRPQVPPPRSCIRPSGLPCTTIAMRTASHRELCPRPQPDTHCPPSVWTSWTALETSCWRSRRQLVSKSGSCLRAPWPPGSSPGSRCQPFLLGEGPAVLHGVDVPRLTCPPSTTDTWGSPTSGPLPTVLLRTWGRKHVCESLHQLLDARPCQILSPWPHGHTVPRGTVAQGQRKMGATEKATPNLLPVPLLQMGPFLRRTCSGGHFCADRTCSLSAPHVTPQPGD